MTITNLVRKMLFAVSPDAALRISAVRSRRNIERRARELGMDQRARAVSQVTGGKVAGGPFEGMVLDYDGLPVNSAPKLLGTYEVEIHSFVLDAIDQQPEKVLNVGSSDGYYAVGFARALPGATVYAADADPKSLSATSKNARLNGVGGCVKTIGVLHTGEFAKYLSESGSLVVMDCEGAEFELLDPIHDPILQKTNMLVEIHEHINSVEVLIERFEATHDASVAQIRERTVSDAPIEVPGYDPLQLMDEWRGRQTWLYLTTKKSNQNLS